MIGDYSYPARVAADKFAQRVALIHGDERWTFAELDAGIDRLAAAFERRGLLGRKVVVLLRNEPLTVVALLALARAGVVAVPVNPRLRVNEIAYIVADCGATGIIADGDFLAASREIAASHAEIAVVLTVNEPSVATGEERLEDLADEPGVPSTVVDGSATAAVVYTSGTSGFPKGVVRTHEANLWATANALIGQPRSSDDVEVFVLPMFGIAFLFQVMPMILAGGTVVVDREFDPRRTWQLLAEHEATRIFLAPTMLDSMLAVEDHEQWDTSSLRTVNTAYEFPERIRMAAAKRLGPVISYMYGLTEAQLCVSTAADFAEDPTVVGHAQGLMRVRVLDDARRPVDAGTVGEIAFAGPALMSGYHAAAGPVDDSIVDGWLLTGDLGYLDDRGCLHISGRKKEIIKTGGFTVDPTEVENVVLQHPGVREAAIVGVPDEHWGERAVLFIVASEQVTPDDIVELVKSRLAAFKAPKQVIVVDELPRTPTGKIQRGRLRQHAGTTAPTEH